PNNLSDYTCAIDEARIDQLLSNLISNAIKNTDEVVGLISIATTVNHEHVTISISDNGRGIAEEELPYIFERFYKQQSRSDEPVGTGLGLAIVKQIVENHRGNITVESEIN